MSNNRDILPLPFKKKEPESVEIFVKVTPKSSHNKIDKIMEDSSGIVLKIYVTAAPEDGKANDHVIVLLSKVLKIPKSKFKIIQGQKSRFKTIKIDKITLELIQKIEAFLQSCQE